MLKATGSPFGRFAILGDPPGASFAVVELCEPAPANAARLLRSAAASAGSPV